MLLRKTGLVVRMLLVLFSLGFLTELALTTDAEARAGNRRSIGQRSQPAAAPRSPAPQQPAAQPPAGRGSFMKGLAGGLAGGILGSMLFSSLGNAAGVGGAGSGGIGLVEIILFAGLAFLAYRFWKSRQNRPAMAAAGAGVGSMPVGMNFPNSAPMQKSSQDAGYFAQGSPSPVIMQSFAQIDSETAEDIFFKVQGAWTRRDLSLVRDYVDYETARILEQDLEDLRRNRSINRLENISIRRVDIGESWAEGNRDFVRVRFTANLLDYTVDESTGELKDGSTSTPVKFDENWIFARSSGQNNWQLAGIEQV